MSNFIGVDPTATYTDAPFAVGQIGETAAGKQYVMVKATSAIAAYDVVTFDETWSTTVAPLSTSNDARGDKVGVAAVAIASGSYGWLQIYGPCTMNVKASCAANVRLNTTATAGSLDDDGTSTTFSVDGIFLTAARAATDGSAAGILNYPAVGAVI